jgi:broad specificity phosphatase PhoE
VFSSDLKRAVETAQAVIDAQPFSTGNAETDGTADADADADAAPLKLELIQLCDLRERDFGSAEGKKFGVGAVGTDAESREQMRLRAERFVREHLVPLFMAERAAAGGCVVVVAHGLILASLLRVLMARFGPAEMAALGSPRVVSWSNTGHAELVVRVEHTGKLLAAEGLVGEMFGDRTSDSAPSPASLPQRPRITLSVVAVNVLKHLEGLKKTRGGIGSAQFDKRQRTMDSFFGPAAKKAKVERGLEAEASPHPSTSVCVDGCDRELGESIFLFFQFPTGFHDEGNKVHRPVPKHYVETLVQPLSETASVLALFCIYLGFQKLTVGKPQVNPRLLRACEWLLGGRHPDPFCRPLAVFYQWFDDRKTVVGLRAQVASK